MRVTKKRITDNLKEKDIYNDIDDFLVDELIYNTKLAQMAKKDINDRGVVVAINAAETLFNTNPSVNVYMSAAKMILNIARKLNLDSRSRVELKLNVELDSDGFDD